MFAFFFVPKRVIIRILKIVIPSESAVFAEQYDIYHSFKELILILSPRY